MKVIVKRSSTKKQKTIILNQLLLPYLKGITISKIFSFESKAKLVFSSSQLIQNMKHLCSCSCNGFMWVTHQGESLTLYNKTQVHAQCKATQMFTRIQILIHSCFKMGNLNLTCLAMINLNKCTNGQMIIQSDLELAKL